MDQVIASLIMTVEETLWMKPTPSQVTVQVEFGTARRSLMRWVVKEEGKKEYAFWEKELQVTYCCRMCWSYHAKDTAEWRLRIISDYSYKFKQSTQRQAVGHLIHLLGRKRWDIVNKCGQFMNLIKLIVHTYRNAYTFREHDKGGK